MQVVAPQLSIRVPPASASALMLSMMPKFAPVGSWGAPLINPRPGGGGGFLAPYRLFNISSEPLRRSSPNLQYPPGHQCYTLWPKIFPKAMIGCPQMTLEWRHVLLFSAQKRFRGKSCQAYSFEDTEKRSGHKRCRIIRATKLPSRNFRFLESWPP